MEDFRKELNEIQSPIVRRLPATKQLVWTGNATNTIDPSSNQEKNQKNLNKAVQKLGLPIQTEIEHQNSVRVWERGFQ